MKGVLYKVVMLGVGIEEVWGREGIWCLNLFHSGGVVGDGYKRWERGQEYMS